MKRILSLLSFAGALTFVVVAAMVQVGCEEASGLNGLTITPSRVTLSTNTSVQTFSVTGGITNQLALPLAWGVSSAALGSISASSSSNALYSRTAANGENTVTVRDQYGNEGYATVTQTSSDYSLTLSASPSTIEVGAASTITITSSSSVSPYVWQLASGAGTGTLTGDSGSTSAVFTGSAVGSAVVQVTDANGVSGTVGITVQDSSSTGGDDGSGGA
ncbi:MAG: hypothetical protein HN341_03685 [Verrucomicrobia bacterium]|jgi:hypothetical protein|nr:hypothetical protein [Verrucomicrobiota bacterium]